MPFHSDSNSSSRLKSIPVLQLSTWLGFVPSQFCCGKHITLLSYICVISSRTKRVLGMRALSVQLLSFPCSFLTKRLPNKRLLHPLLALKQRQKWFSFGIDDYTSPRHLLRNCHVHNKNHFENKRNYKMCKHSLHRDWWHLSLSASFYRLQRRCGQVMFLHQSLILFSGGSCRHPPGQTPP